MTINSLVRTVGPIIGDDIATSFPFAFKIFQTSELLLIKTIAGVDSAMVLNTDYSVVLNQDQNAAPGGTITFKLAGITSPIPTGTTINGTSNVQNLQQVKLTNNGGFFPAVINDALDRLTILVQQIVRGLNSAIKLPLSDGTGINSTLPNIATRASKLLAFDALGNVIVSNQTLATIENPGASAIAAAASAAAALVSQNAAAQSATDANGFSVAAAASAAAAAASAAGQKWRPSVKAATTGALPTCTYNNGTGGVGATLTATVNGALPSQDAVALAVNDRLLVKDQVAGLQNGVYTVTQLGSGGTPWILTRATDADAWLELVSQVVAVEQGTANLDKIYICTVDQGGTIGTTSVSWASITSGFGSITTFRLVAGVDFTAGVSTTLNVPAGGLLMLNFDGITQNTNDYTFNPSTGVITLSSAVPVGVTQISGSIISVLSLGTPGNNTVGPQQMTDAMLLQHGQCRLTKSGANLLLSRYNGKYLVINGTPQIVPSAGVTLAPTSLTPGTTYYIYAWMNSGTMTLEASTTGHSTDATTGVEIKTGDATRTLVGMARPITGPAWNDTAQIRFVISFFNRKDVFASFTTSSTLSSAATSYTELSTGARVEFLTWGDESVQVLSSGPVSNSAANTGYTIGISIDGAAPEQGNGLVSGDTAARRINFAQSPAPRVLSEGYHYSTLVSLTGSGTVSLAPDAPTYNYVQTTKILG